MCTHMSGECTVFTCPAYSSWSSIGINTLSPSTRESLSSTHCTGAEHNTTPNSNKYTCYHFSMCDNLRFESAGTDRESRHSLTRCCFVLGQVRPRWSCCLGCVRSLRLPPCSPSAGSPHPWKAATQTSRFDYIPKKPWWCYFPCNQIILEQEWYPPRHSGFST